MHALIFDFDGVIVLSEGPRFKVIQQMARKHAIKLPESAISFMVGRTTKNFLADTLPEVPDTIKQSIIVDYEAEYKGHITKYVQPVIFVVEFIKNYTGNIPFALASMSDRSVIEEIAKHFGIYEKFASILSKDDIIHPKPDPEIYLKAAARLGVSPKNCAVIEDTAVGVQAALTAGMICYSLLNRFNTEQDFNNLEVAGSISTREDLEKIVSN